MEKVSETKVDIELIQRLKDRDEAAFELIYKSYHKYIYYMARQYFDDDEFARDIVQETFIKVFKQVDNLNSPEAFTVWIKKITYSICHNTYKSRKRDSLFYTDDKEDLLDIVFENEKAVLPEKEVNFNEVKDIIIATLEELKPEFRVIGYLRLFEQLSFEEIADISGISVGTVGSRIARIRKKLQITLSKNGYSTTTCCSIVATPFLFSIYQSWAESLTVPEVSMPVMNKQNTVSKGAANHSIQNSVHHFYTYGAIVTILLTSFIGVQVAKQTNDANRAVENYITAIRYDEEYTNKALEIKVETKNNDYDEIQIDGINTMLIKANGKHVITIRKDGIQLDEKEIIIRNIDKEGPLMTESNILEDSIIITIVDKDSGIDYSATKLKGNDQYTVKSDQSKGEFTLDKNIGKESSLMVYDMAGNMTLINITQLEIMRQIN